MENPYFPMAFPMGFLGGFRFTMPWSFWHGSSGWGRPTRRRTGDTKGYHGIWASYNNPCSPEARIQLAEDFRLVSYSNLLRWDISQKSKSNYY